MSIQKLKVANRKRRHQRTRLKVQGTPQRPRLSVYCSNRNLYTQIVDDTRHKTLLSVSTLDKELKQKISFAGNTEAAKLLGQLLSERAKEKGISKVVLDKGPYLYHGRIKHLAESARTGGLVF